MRRMEREVNFTLLHLPIQYCWFGSKKQDDFYLNLVVVFGLNSVALGHS